MSEKPSCTHHRQGTLGHRSGGTDPQKPTRRKRNGAWQASLQIQPARPVIEAVGKDDPEPGEKASGRVKMHSRTAVWDVIHTAVFIRADRVRGFYMLLLISRYFKIF